MALRPSHAPQTDWTDRAIGARLPTASSPQPATTASGASPASCFPQPVLPLPPVNHPTLTVREGRAQAQHAIHLATEDGRRARAEASPYPIRLPPEAQAQAFASCTLGAWGPGGPQRVNIDCATCCHFVARLAAHHEPMLGAVRWIFLAPHTDSAVTCSQHQEVASLFAYFNAEFASTIQVPSIQGIQADSRHILYKAVAVGLPASMLPVRPEAMREVRAYLEHHRLDPVSGCFNLDRAMEAATHLAHATNGHRRDALVRSHTRANAAARALARLAQASTLGTAIAVSRIHQPAGTTVPDDHVLGFLDSGPEDNDAVRTVLLLLDAARAERQRHG